MEISEPEKSVGATVRKYVPLRERQVEMKDIRVDSGSSLGRWEGFIE